MKNLYVALAILVLNLPFGWWREGTRKLSLPWFLAVHVPVPLAVGLRFASGLGFRLATLPLFVAAFFGGQFLGGRLRRRSARAAERAVPPGAEAAGTVEAAEPSDG
jgi:hypothetical protein